MVSPGRWPPPRNAKWGFPYLSNPAQIRHIAFPIAVFVRYPSVTENVRRGGSCSHALTYKRRGVGMARIHVVTSVYVIKVASYHSICRIRKPHAARHVHGSMLYRSGVIATRSFTLQKYRD